LSQHLVPSFPNKLLSVLSRKDYAQFLSACTEVSLVSGDVIAKRGTRATHAWFPTGGFISLIVPMNEGTQLEVGLVGNEGMVGASFVLNVDTSPCDALVQGRGSALRINGTTLRRQLAQMPSLEQCLKRYVHVTVEQLGQTAACTRFHLVEARLARWLLMTRDRAHADTFRVTQEFLACMLGVRRVGVTKAARALQERELISYHRGVLTIADGPGLEHASCGCYAADKLAYENILG
jgi:CRP-like cAMP-binding protein